MKRHADTFEEYYATTDDPWGFRTRWYERRKRDLLVACLPDENYLSGWEMGCSNGELAAALAPRCETLLATDGNRTALAAARRRLETFPEARTEKYWVPQEWPDGRFQLIVLSEMAYYLDGDNLREVCQKLRETLADGGTFVACHWRPAIPGCVLTGDEVHAILKVMLPWTHLIHHLEDDFRLDIWTDNPKSVAQREGSR